MKIPTSFILATFALFSVTCFALEVRTFAGTQPEGAACSVPMVCVEPFYCLKANETDYTCAKKPCQGQDECRIGQYCTSDSGGGYCAAPKCNNDLECAGATVCQIDGQCGSKSNGGQKCTGDSQCWSGKCTDEVCSDDETDDDDDQGIVGNTTDDVADTVKKVLGGGAIAGIVLGCLLLIAICCGMLFCCNKMRNVDK